MYIEEYMPHLNLQCIIIIELPFSLSLLCVLTIFTAKEMNNNKNRTHSGNNKCFIGIELESLENAEKKMCENVR